MFGDPGSAANLREAECLVLCPECLEICNNRRTFEKSFSVSTKDQRGRDCRLCRLLLSMSLFAQQMRIDPLRSYDVKVLPLVHDVPIAQLRLIQEPDKHHPGILATNSELPLSSFSITEKYLDHGKYERKGIFTMKLARSMSLQSRLRLGGVKTAESDFNKEARALVHDIWKMNPSESFNRVSQWMSNCSQHHKLCSMTAGASAKVFNTFTTVCPLRLVEIEHSAIPPTLRLVEFTGEIPSYITLSHRWSSLQQFKTTEANREIHSVTIPFMELPKTFKDAVKVARELAVKYLWIDSICIVQDDDDDWRLQSEQMGSIYQTSLCTLAAIDAYDGSKEDQGLFSDGDLLPFSVLLENRYQFQYNHRLPDPHVLGNTRYTLNGDVIDADERSTSAWEASSFTLKPSPTTFEMSVDRSEWNHRAWIFQERMLSRRVLYFTKEQIFWECAEHITSEYADRNITARDPELVDAAEGSNRLHTALRRVDDVGHQAQPVAEEPRYGDSFFDLWDEHQRLRVWWDLVERYSGNQLTHKTDKWYAIAGLCAVLQNHFRSAIHAGVWENATGSSILWHARDEALRMYEKYHAPSWSWLGVDGAVKFAYQDELYTGYTQKVKTLYQNPSFSMTDPKPSHGVVGFSGTLTLSCPSRRAGLSSQQWSDFLFNESTGRHDQDPPAWKFFDEVSHGKSQLELSKEFKFQNLPSRTRLLTGDDDRAIGWVVMDFDTPSASEIVCAAIAMRILNNHRTPQQHILECVALIHSPSESGTYRRVGRGRVVERGWLDTCTTEVFRIV